MKHSINLVFFTGMFMYCSITRAQKCPKGSDLITFNNTGSGVAISACVPKEPSLGAQVVLWGVKNNTSDKLEVKFTKVLELVCGNSMRNEASVIIKGGEFMGGGTFFGDDITLDDQVWKEDCNRNGNRIQRVRYENLKVINLSKNERDEAERQRLQEEKRVQEEEAKQKAEEEEASRKKEEAEKQRLVEEEKQKKAEEEERKAKEEEDEKTKAKEEEEAQKREVKRIQDSVDYTWKERNDRVERHKEEQQEKEAIAAGMTAGAAALIVSDVDNSKILGRRTYFKLGAYTGMNSIPAYENTESPEMQSLNYSSTDAHLPFTSEVELQTMLYKVKMFSLEIGPFLQYGLTFMGGDNGTYLGYGGRGTVTFGRKLKLYATAAYESRTGENTYDHDAAAESVGYITNTKAVGKLFYDYSVISYGGGLFFDTDNRKDEDQEDKYVQLGAIIHKTSMTDARYTNAELPVKMLLGAQFKWVLGGGFTVAAEYIPNYTVAGETAFQPSSYDKKDYWYAKIGKTFNLSSSK